MSEFAELRALIELSEQLTTAEIIQIQTITNMPEGLCKDATKASDFLTAIKQWKYHDPYQFYLALEDLRPDLIAVACEVSWLCVSTPNEFEIEEKELTIKTLIDLLKSEIPRDKWGMIYMTIANEAMENVGFEVTLNKMAEKGYIHKDLAQLCQILKVIKRDDIVEKMKPYLKAFSGMEDGEFEWKFKREETKAKK